jgi:hypothetical protein
MSFDHQPEGLKISDIVLVDDCQYVGVKLGRLLVSLPKDSTDKYKYIVALDMSNKLNFGYVDIVLRNKDRFWNGTYCKVYIDRTYQ